MAVPRPGLAHAAPAAGPHLTLPHSGTTEALRLSLLHKQGNKGNTNGFQDEHAGVLSGMGNLHTNKKLLRTGSGIENKVQNIYFMFEPQ